MLYSLLVVVLLIIWYKVEMRAIKKKERAFHQQQKLMYDQPEVITRLPFADEDETYQQLKQGIALAKTQEQLTLIFMNMIIYRKTFKGPYADEYGKKLCELYGKKEKEFRVPLLN